MIIISTHPYYHEYNFIQNINHFKMIKSEEKEIVISIQNERTLNIIYKFITIENDLRQSFIFCTLLALRTISTI